MGDNLLMRLHSHILDHETKKNCICKRISTSMVFPYQVFVHYDAYTLDNLTQVIGLLTINIIIKNAVIHTSNFTNSTIEDNQI